MSLACALILIAAIFSENLDMHIDPEIDAGPRIIAAAFVFLSGNIRSFCGKGLRIQSGLSPHRDTIKTAGKWIKLIL
jgi:hypothetical protein